MTKTNFSKNFTMDEYDSHMDKNPPEFKYMLESIQSRCYAGISILELGAGTGRFTKKIRQMFPEAKITLLEPDSECLTKLKLLESDNVSIIEKTAQEMDYHNEFDIVCMATAFHHIEFESKVDVLKKISSSLKKNGVFIMCDNFIADYSNEVERKQVLDDYHDKWISDAIKAGNKEDETMARKMKLLVQKDDGGEYFTSAEKFDELVNGVFKVVKKVNVTAFDNPEEGNKFFYELAKL